MADESNSSGEQRSQDPFSFDYSADEPSSVGPSEEEVEAWAERERRRRQAWLDGPTEEEKREWARAERERRTANAPGYEDFGGAWPSEEEVEAWAERERRRRQAWLDGPTEEEKREWARSRRRARTREPHRKPHETDYDSFREFDPGERHDVRRMRREAELAAEGAWRWLWDYPYWMWARLVRTGREAETVSREGKRRSRVPFFDD